MEHTTPRPLSRRSTPPPRPPPPELTESCFRSESTAMLFIDFQQQHDKAFKSVEKALAADEHGDTANAKEYYSQGLVLLDQALAVDCEHLVNATQEEKDEAKMMQMKMNKSRLQIAYRLEALQADNRPAVPELFGQSEELAVRLPSYEEAILSSSSSLSDLTLGESISAAEHEAQQLAITNGTQLFSIVDGVQIFFITPQGYVSAPSYPSSLHVVKFEDQIGRIQETSATSEMPPAFMQVGDWVYPLLPQASPILHTTYGAYIFPDLTSEEAGASVGLILPDNITDTEKHCLEDILRNFSAVQEQLATIHPEDLVEPSAPQEDSSSSMVEEIQISPDEAGKQSTSSKISKGIIIASEWISWGLGKGAQKTGELINKGSVKLRTKLQPLDQTRPVNPHIQKGMDYARKASHAAQLVSGFIVSQLGKATVALGKQLAPHIREQGKKILPSSMKTSESQSKLNSVLEVAASGVQGFGTVYLSLEKAAKALARSLANETVSIIHHRYGEEAGMLTENTLYTAGNVVATGYNINHLGVKAIAKQAAKNTSKALICGSQNGHMNQCASDSDTFMTDEKDKKKR